MNIFISPKNIPSRMFCPICGIVNDDNDKCCKSCGFKFEKNHQNKPNPAINTNTSYIDPLYDSLTGFLSSLIPQIIEMARKEIVYLVIPAILIAVLTYFGINQYVIELIAGSDGFTKMGNCFPKYGNICNIAGFETNNLFFISAFGSLFFVGAFIGSLAGTIRSLGVSKYLSQVSGLVSTISSTVSGEKKQGIPIILLGFGAGIVFGVIFSSTYIMSLSIIGLLINSLISGRMGLLSPILQYAHRDIMRKFFDRNNTHLIDESSVSIGVTGGVLGYTVSTLFFANNLIFGILIGISIIALGGHLIFKKGQIPKFIPILFLILFFGILIPPLVQQVSAHDGGYSECGAYENWDECPGSERVKEEASKSATAAAAGVATGVVVGGVGSVAAKAAAMARARKEALKGEEDSEEGPIGYILQLSKDSLTIGVGKSDSFTATAWKVEKDGSYSQEHSASISIVAPGIPELNLSDTSGTGSLIVTVSLTDSTDTKSADLTVNASAGGSEFSAQVSVTIEESIMVGFE